MREMGSWEGEKRETKKRRRWGEGKRERERGEEGEEEEGQLTHRHCKKFWRK